MEYCYTREFNQKHKLYTIGGKGIPFAPNGIALESILLFFGIIAVLAVIAVVAFVKKVSFLQSLFTNAYLIIIFGVVIFVWFLFSLTWDNKSFFGFLKGRFTFFANSRIQTEHEHKTVLYKQKVSYQRKKRWI
ncbi:hypothetical protein A5819_003512 [Enterococcus sp. 7E2_DIV0204]|uniref:TcpE family conjugal transfer membrane protein n=1 Tax=unclassified Enterococcus TaxID=2608891 RepID=UPI000A357DD7|nr:hypothetical protein A5819_003512 [Enterococcus sp. 7E2_DIV0204]OTP46870.1 hypothetical protein A5884_003748 [Enterococcus sp. 7D2_DIV0200]